MFSNFLKKIQKLVGVDIQVNAMQIIWKPFTR